MRKTTMIWFAVAAFLILAGCIMFGSVMTVFGWDFTKLSTGNYETKHHEIREDFHAISVNTDTADMTFVRSEDTKCTVECYEQKGVTHCVTVKDGTLVIETVDARKWYEYIGIRFGTPKVTVYLPRTEYTTLFIKESTGDIEMPRDFQFENADLSLSTGDVNFFASASERIKIQTSTGKIRLEHAFAGALDLSASTGGITVSNVICEGDMNLHVSTGKTNLTDLSCRNLTSSGSTGNISLSNVVAAEKLSIKRSTGDISFDRSDAGEIFVQTDTGHVKGSLLTDKVFIAQTDTGTINVPKTQTGGRCEIDTDTGNIKITVES